MDIIQLLQAGAYIGILIAVYQFGRRALVQVADIFCAYAGHLFRKPGEKVSVILQRGRVRRVFCEHLDTQKRICGAAGPNKGKSCILHEP